MGYQPLEDLLPKTGYSIYKLVRMAANRAIELSDGKKRLVEVPNVEKTTTIALEEIRAGKIVLKELADKFKPQEKPKGKQSEENKTAKN